jgi:CheY-like chemotaxis protein
MPGGPLRVVVVDNDPDALELVVTDLTLEGHAVVGQARDGETALALCSDLEPDVLVTDYRMAPGINGVTVARRIRDRDSAIRVILYSNYRDREIQTAAERAGAQYLEKGDLAALRRAVRGDGR